MPIQYVCSVSNAFICVVFVKFWFQFSDSARIFKPYFFFVFSFRKEKKNSSIFFWQQHLNATNIWLNGFSHFSLHCIISNKYYIWEDLTTSVLVTGLMICLGCAIAPLVSTTVTRGWSWTHIHNSSSIRSIHWKPTVRIFFVS